MKKIMLIYPPSKLFQRGEDRCQSSIEDSASTSIRACNDLGHISSILKEQNCKIFLKDYQTEKLDFDDLLSDFKKFNPDVLFISITNTTIFDDIKVINKLKKTKSNFVTILKGAIFFDPEKNLIKQLNLKEIDYLIGGESEFIISNLINFHFFNKDKINTINGILYKKNNTWIKTNFSIWDKNLDKIPFPDRKLMNNLLYTRPDTEDAQATISTSRGCPSNCIFCLTPTISGKKLRLRSPSNIFEEINECYNTHKIKNFFFKSDTFTINKKWVLELCNLIINSDLFGKIEWVANSRTKPIDKETLEIMKKAGCWLVAFGFESGSPETLEKTKKGTSLEDNYRATKYAKEVGLKIFGFYMIGFPWENKTHLEKTKKMIFKINADFIELHLATPFYGTELYKMAKKENLIQDTILGKDYFNPPIIGTKYLSLQEIVNYKKKLLIKYHLRPRYIIKKVCTSINKPKILKNYVKFGIKLIKNNWKWITY